MKHSNPVVVFRWFEDGPGFAYPSTLRPGDQETIFDAIRELADRPNGAGFDVNLKDGRHLVGDKQRDPRSPGKGPRDGDTYLVRCVVVDSSVPEKTVSEVARLLHQYPLPVEPGAYSGLEFTYEMRILRFPVIVYRWFRKGSALAYPVSFDVPQRKMVFDALDQVDRKPIGSSFRVGLKDGRELVGEKLADPECPDEKGRGRHTYLIRAVIVGASLDEAAIWDLMLKLRDLPLPVDAGGADGLELAYESFVADMGSSTRPPFRKIYVPPPIQAPFDRQRPARTKDEREPGTSSSAFLRVVKSWFTCSMVLGLFIVGLLFCVFFSALASWFR